MTDDELVQAFDAANVPAELLRHPAHDQVAWW